MSTNTQPKTVLIAVLVVILSVCLTPDVEAGPSSTRLKAMDILYRAYSRLEGQRDNYGGVSEISIKLAKIDIDRALVIDPEFAYAHIVRAEVALMEENWEVARDYFLKGIKLTYQPDQIYSPDSSFVITAKEVRNDAQVFLAFSYFQLANEAIMKYDLVSAQLRTEKAKSTLKTCLASNPSPQTGEMAEELLAIVEHFFDSN